MDAARWPGLKRLEVGAQTGFVLTAAGRVLCVNDPMRSPAPRFTIAGCTQGNLFHLRYDVGERTAEAIHKLARDEPPLVRRDSVPVHMAEYVELLERESPVKRREIGLGYELPNRLATEHNFKTVSSGTAEGDALYAKLAANGVPEGLRGMGFKDEKEFWEPWCFAFHDSEVASVAFAARLGEKGAATGVATARAFRGKGLAAAAVSVWTWDPRLADLMLGYSHNRDNRSSQRVAERLGLSFIGASAAIY